MTPSENILQYVTNECSFFDGGKSYATLKYKENGEWKIFEFETKELANDFLRYIKSLGDDFMKDIAYQFLVEYNWIEVYAFKGKFFDNYQIILQHSNKFFGKKFAQVNFYL